jgi:hypothetical protein
LLYLRIYATIQEVFTICVPKGPEKDRVMTINEWKNTMVNVMVAAQSWAKFTRLKSVSLSSFNEMDYESKGIVDIQGFTRWIIDGEI